jgi:hypothetical protein
MRHAGQEVANHEAGHVAAACLLGVPLVDAVVHAGLHGWRGLTRVALDGRTDGEVLFLIAGGLAADRAWTGRVPDPARWAKDRQAAARLKGGGVSDEWLGRLLLAAARALDALFRRPSVEVAGEAVAELLLASPGRPVPGAALESAFWEECGDDCGPPGMLGPSARDLLGPAALAVTELIESRV